MAKLKIKDKKDKKDFLDRLEKFPTLYPGTPDIISTTINIPKKYQNIKCDGSSIWMNSKFIVSKVTEVLMELHLYNSTPSEDAYYIQFYVKHNAPWEIYTDKGFEKNISDVLSKLLKIPCKIGFTEQGMQNTHIASLETCKSPNEWKIAAYILEKYLNEGNK